eukprot:SAG22_NODE_465_length_10181_cov_6.604444_17_plen_70_part_00
MAHSCGTASKGHGLQDAERPAVLAFLVEPQGKAGGAEAYLGRRVVDHRAFGAVQAIHVSNMDYQHSMMR